jgi:hypothetical protein
VRQAILRSSPNPVEPNTAILGVSPPMIANLQQRILE